MSREKVLKKGSTLLKQILKNAAETDSAAPTDVNVVEVAMFGHMDGEWKDYIKEIFMKQS